MSATNRPDVVVTWLQNDYGQLGRAAESIAHALQSSGMARQVAYVEPNVAGPESARLDAVVDRGVHVYRRSGAEVQAQVVARAVVQTSGLVDPILLNFGVTEANWWFHHAFAPLVRRTTLITHDIPHLWPGIEPARGGYLSRIRSLLVQSSDLVLGLATGAIADIPGARYVGHGCDEGIELPSVDALPEPADLAAIPRPRALYFGALSVRIDHRALAALAHSGIEVVLVGIAPSPAVAEVIATHGNVHFLGPRPPGVSAAYLRHCDIGIVPHTDEDFTWSMEPHKIYNYACAGLRSVLLNCACPPVLAGAATTTADVDGFVGACHRALAQGRLDAFDREVGRAQTWRAVAGRILGHVAATDQGEASQAALPPVAVAG